MTKMDIETFNSLFWDICYVVMPYKTRDIIRSFDIEEIKRRYYHGRNNREDSRNKG